MQLKGIMCERDYVCTHIPQVRESEIEEAHKQRVEERTATLAAAQAPRLAALAASQLTSMRHLASARQRLQQPSSDAGFKIIGAYANDGSPGGAGCGDVREGWRGPRGRDACRHAE